MASAKHMQLERSDTGGTVEERRGGEGAAYCIGMMIAYGRKKLR